jgi:NADH-quinone oxidoreductase subunit J
MIENQWPYAVAVLLFAAGMWLLLPRGVEGGRRLGMGLTACGLALLALLVHFGLIVARHSPYLEWSPPQLNIDGWIADVVFLALAGLTVGSAVGAVTLKSPVYCAIWFAMTLLGTGGLFLYQGAQFLGVATVVVYAGAILVTFLFVLMLAQPQGYVYYDRLSWEALLSACAGAVMVGVLTITLASAFRNPKTELVARYNSDQLKAKILNSEHMAQLGSQLFSTQLIAVEIAGTLLLVALVGAVAIISQAQPLARDGRGRSS